MAFVDVVGLIELKRDGESLTADQIGELIAAYTADQIPDYQMSALLMASFLRGMSDTETNSLTRAMLFSGEVLDLSDLPGLKVDKHSTGGVGDKISIILAPIVAACGVPVPMISGRGLGHTGGTLDKLEAIPGFRTNLSINQYRKQLDEIGIVMIGQTDEIAPADRKLYALRDVTGTVEFIPFIAASIMSKKLAEGIDALVLDVKTGKGAFMKEREEARRLAETLVRISEHFETPSVALLTDMDTPLGYGVGNWPETAEAIRCLKGEDVPDVMNLTFALAAEMLQLGGKASSFGEGVKMARDAVSSHRAYEVLLTMVKKQGGDVRYLDSPASRPGSSPVAEVLAPEDAFGFVKAIDALAIGKAAVAMGAGRQKKEHTVDPTAGITLNKRPGDPVEPGEILAWLHTSKQEMIAGFETSVRCAYSYSPDEAPEHPLLLDRYSGEGWSGKPIVLP